MLTHTVASYLANLRNNRVARPGGARPLPQDSRQQISRQSMDRTGLSPAVPPKEPAKSVPAPPVSVETNIAASVSSRYSYVTDSARDYYPETPTVPLKPSEVVPSATYIERGQRWMEKEDVVYLRQAMEDMDVKDQGDRNQDNEDASLYKAALDEAAELVWQHQHGQPPKKADAPYRYKPHLRRNSYAHARTASVGSYGSEIGASGLARNTSRSVSGSSTSSGSRRVSEMSHRSLAASPDDDTRPSEPQTTRAMAQPTKSYKGIVSCPVPTQGSRRRSSMKRNVSGEIDHPFSGDQIWEEPESNTPDRKPMAPTSTGAIRALEDKARSPLNRPQSPSSFQALPKLRSTVEIHQNEPTQTRNPQYRVNRLSNTAPAEQSLPKTTGKEVRSDDIRQATSMRIGNRSGKLPQPSAVSDSPGRPIVSFDPRWKASEESVSGMQGPSRRGSANPQPNPTILLPGDDAEISSKSVPVQSPGQTRARNGPAMPSISIDPCPPIPMIVTPDDDILSQKSRPLPQPSSASRKSQSARRPRAHWSPAPGVRATAACHECGFPIEGRFVGLAGTAERFHPQCFTCYSCGTSLEALEISPEPETYRNERLDRISRRQAGEVVDGEPGKTAADDGDERLRFFCHLDWHELFAPKCKHCKTPIIGEHVAALGEHWHYGHFFCAECGDPFEQGMTHIEKDGYAWCVNCQTRRTERRAPKCKKCKKAVIGQYIMAMGGEWHDECFRCATCQGTFDDGQIFPKEGGAEGVVLCTNCRAMELKA
jgi:hypothetical protein